MSSGSPVEFGSTHPRASGRAEPPAHQQYSTSARGNRSSEVDHSTPAGDFRLLGYVANDPRQGGYQVTSGVRGLSSGFHGDPLVVLKAPGDVKAWEAHLADPIVTPQNTLDYYSAVEKAAGGSVADHFRLITEAGFDPLTALENGSRTVRCRDQDDKDGNVLAAAVPVSTKNDVSRSGRHQGRRQLSLRDAAEESNFQPLAFPSLRR